MGFLAAFGLSAAVLSSVSVFVSVCCVSGFRSAVVPVAASDSGIYKPTNQFEILVLIPLVSSLSSVPVLRHLYLTESSITTTEINL